MTPAPKADMEAAKVALFDYDDAPALETVDRSTLQNAMECPWRAKAIADGRCNTVGILAEAGEAVHQAQGSMIRSWIDSHGAMSKTDLRMELELAVRGARPDLQPEAIKALQPAAWLLADTIYKIHPGNILAFDGGEDVDRSGQLAYDFPDLGVRYTSELDLLYQGDCPEVLEEIDTKSGWKDWASEDIRDSFQFQSHAVLVLEKYPDAKALRVRVLDARHRTLTYGVHFQRERLYDWKVRIRSAISAWRQSQGENPPVWPTLEGCTICPASAICPVADQPIKDLATDPAAFVRDLVAVEARAESMRKLAAAWVDANKREIDAGGGVLFGRGKPRSERKATATIYSMKGNSNDNGS